MKDKIQKRAQEFRAGVYALRKRTGLWFKGVLRRSVPPEILTALAWVS